MAAPKGNKNAESWTENEAVKFINEALVLSKRKCDYIVSGKSIKGYEFDFLGEIARELESYIDVFDYLCDKFPELKKVKNNIKSNCEANCFSNSKKGIIKEATAIVNLKSNHGWTDRQQMTLPPGAMPITLNVTVDKSDTAETLKKLRDGIG